MGIRKSGGMRNQNQDTLREGEKAIFNKREKTRIFKKVLTYVLIFQI